MTWNLMKIEEWEVKFNEKGEAFEMANSYVRPVSDSFGGDGSSQICRL